MRVEGRWVVITLTISPLIRPKTPHGFISHQSGGTSPKNMNLLVNEPPRRPGQPLCQDPWSRQSQSEYSSATTGASHRSHQRAYAAQLRPGPPATNPSDPGDEKNSCRPSECCVGSSCAACRHKSTASRSDVMLAHQLRACVDGGQPHLVPRETPSNLVWGSPLGIISIPLPAFS